MYEFPSMKDIAENRERMRKEGDAVRMMSDQSDEVVAGNFYTVTASFSAGDRSWTECFWEVLAVCGPKAFVRIHERFGEGKIERFWEIEDRAWYLANEAWGLSGAKSCANE